jgi:hypothetical protein
MMGYRYLTAVSCLFALPVLLTSFIFDFLLGVFAKDDGLDLKQEWATYNKLETLLKPKILWLRARFGESFPFRFLKLKTVLAVANRRTTSWSVYGSLS